MTTAATLTLPGNTNKGGKGKGKGKGKGERKPKSLPVRDRVIGVGYMILAVAVLSVSLPHLTQGMHATLGVGWFAAGALAVLFDLSQIASEAFLLMVAKTDAEKWVAKGVIIGATAVSIAYNGMAFLAHATNGFGVMMALTFAVLLPVGVLALSYLGSRALFGTK